MSTPQVLLNGAEIEHNSDDGILEEQTKGTPLDRTIDRIGMGGYQYSLLALCGLGWAADNMWLQAVAIALPRVQVHYSISSTAIGALSSAIFAGMMLGAVGWGTFSDLFGRILVFNCTLFFTSVFGFLEAFADSFLVLCLANFFLGTAVGGSMPTDGTLALETLPRQKRHLLTSLSMFFSIGSVIAAFVALLVIPANSCRLPSPCDASKDNKGWKYLMLILSVITLLMFLSRVLFFRFYESPRFLVHAGRKEEAAIALNEIAKFNGNKNFNFTTQDVADEVEDEPDLVIPPSTPLPTATYGDIRNDEPDGVETEVEGLLPTQRSGNPLPSPSHIRRRQRSSSSSIIRSRGSPFHFLPKIIRRPLNAWYMRIIGLLSSEWKERTLLIWAIWLSMALAYTMFNVYLPTLLEYRSSARSNVRGFEAEDETEKGLEGPLWEVVIFTLGGCPGALVGAFLIDKAPRHNISKSKVLAGATFCTAISCLAFILVDGYITVMITTVGMSLSSTAMWAILYGMTPELFATEVRGTACGTASALSRIGGVLAPLIGGALVSISPSLVIVASVLVFCIACVLLVMLDRSLTRAVSNQSHSLNLTVQSSSDYPEQ